MVNMAPRDTPAIGIFWICEGHIIPWKTALVEAETYGEVFICPDAHVDVWNELARAGILTRKYGVPSWALDDYALIPRGRLTYAPSQDLFVVLHGNRFSEKDRQMVVDTFGLHGQRVRYRFDDHYVVPDGM